jgi:AraC family transcriptional activator of tynA and feaB
MPVLAFDMTTANHQYRRFEFRGEHNKDYYDGDLECLSGRDVDMKIEKSTPGEYAIYKLTSRSGLTFRRSWAHIRKDKTNVTVFWFVRRGQIAVSHAGIRHVVNPHECMITRSSKAFFMELTPDEGGVLEAMHLVVPSHKLYAVIGENAEVGKPIPASKGDIAVMERMLTLLFEEDADIDPDIAEQMAETLLAGLSKTVARVLGNPVARPSIADKRISDITRYINQNFSNPDLNQKMVADRCGISLRYLCHILKKHDLSFSTLVWERRMATSRDWLQDAKMQHYSISEIAYMAGFKSSAHFSRMFKMRFGVAPREYRQMQGDEAAALAVAGVADDALAFAEVEGGQH